MKSGEEFQVNSLKKMIRFIVLLSLETQVRKATKEKKPSKGENIIVQREYDQLVAETEPYKRALPERPSLGKRIKASFRNVKNVAINAYDNTIGYGIAKYQNRQTVKHFKKNPESLDNLDLRTYGWNQNIGAGHREVSQARKIDPHTRHFLFKASSNLTGKEGVDESYNDIGKNLYKKSGLKHMDKRRIRLKGHSSGGNRVIEMSGDERVYEYGIKETYAVAPTPTGFKPKTLGQKILGPFASKENTNYAKGQRAAVELSGTKPKVPVYVIAGKYDGLVPPKDAAYKHAEEHYIIDHPDSTHFGTSGSNPRMNKLIFDLMNRKPARYKRKGKVLQMEVTGQQRYYKDAA